MIKKNIRENQKHWRRKIESFESQRKWKDRTREKDEWWKKESFAELTIRKSRKRKITEKSARRREKISEN